MTRTAPRAISSENIKKVPVWGGTGQRKLRLDMCQLTITLMSSIKEGRYKPRLYFFVFPISCTMAAILRDSVVFVRAHKQYR